MSILIFYQLCQAKYCKCNRDKVELSIYTKSLVILDPICSITEAARVLVLASVNLPLKSCIFKARIKVLNFGMMKSHSDYDSWELQRPELTT